MKFYESAFDYNYSFTTVSLAYFLRYPNPYAKHVLSTDVIDRYFDPATHRLHTTRLHLKKSKVPAGILKLLPKGLAGPGGASQSYVVEKSIVDVREGWMETESRNMEWTGILSVVERQSYRRQPLSTETRTDKLTATDAGIAVGSGKDWTACKTIVTFVSRLGQTKMMNRGRKTEISPALIEEEAPKLGFFKSWTTSGIQRTVELIGLERTKGAVAKSKEGMNVVLERLRSGGVIGALQGMKDDLEAFRPEGPWKKVLLGGSQGAKPNSSHGATDVD